MGFWGWPLPQDDAAERAARAALSRSSTANPAAPFDLIGITDPGRRNLHPIDLDVLIRRAALLGLDRPQVLAALPRLRGDGDISS